MYHTSQTFAPHALLSYIRMSFLQFPRLSDLIDAFWVHRVICDRSVPYSLPRLCAILHLALVPVQRWHFGLARLWFRLLQLCRLKDGYRYSRSLNLPICCLTPWNLKFSLAWILPGLLSIVSVLQCQWPVDKCLLPGYLAWVCLCCKLTWCHTAPQSVSYENVSMPALSITSGTVHSIVPKQLYKFLVLSFVYVHLYRYFIFVVSLNNSVVFSIMLLDITDVNVILKLTWINCLIIQLVNIL